MIALAQNSPPALNALENFGAGIDCFSTYAKKPGLELRSFLAMLKQIMSRLLSMVTTRFMEFIMVMKKI